MVSARIECGYRWLPLMQQIGCRRTLSGSSIRRSHRPKKSRFRRMARREPSFTRSPSLRMGHESPALRFPCATTGSYSPLRLRLTMRCLLGCTFRILPAPAEYAQVEALPTRLANAAPIDVAESRELHQLSNDLPALGAEIRQLSEDLLNRSRESRGRADLTTQQINEKGLSLVAKFENKYARTYRDRALASYDGAARWGALGSRPLDRSIVEAPTDVVGLRMVADCLLEAGRRMNRIRVERLG